MGKRRQTAHDVDRAQSEFETLKAAHGLRDPKTLEAMSELAAALLKVEDDRRAEPLLRELLQLEELIHGTDAYETRRAALMLGSALYNLRKFEMARDTELCLVSATIAAEWPGSDSALVALRQLCKSLIVLGDIAQMRRVGDPIIDGRLASSSRDAGPIVDTLLWLADWWRYVGDARRASKLYKRLIRSTFQHGRLLVAARALRNEVLYVPWGLLLIRLKEKHGFDIQAAQENMANRAVLSARKSLNRTSDHKRSRG